MTGTIRTDARSTMARTRAWSIAMLTLLVAFAACQSTPAAGSTDALGAGAPNQLTRAERDAGWRLLFDGKSLAGWRGLGYPGVQDAHWTVEDGTIRKIANEKVAKGSDGRRLPGGDLMTVATFKDFELAWDWKMSAVGQQRLEVQRVRGAVRRPAVERRCAPRRARPASRTRRSASSTR